MSAQSCDRCGQEMRDGAATVCRACIRHLRRTLDAIADMWPHLEEAITRQTRMTAPTDGGHSDERPVPFDPRASAIAHGARNALTSWVRITVEDLGATWPANTIGAYCRHLKDQTRHIRMQRWATEMIDGLTDDAGAITRAVDYSDERSRIHVGPCPMTEDGEPCPGQVFAHISRNKLDRPVMRCHACRAEWLAEQWARAGDLIRQRQRQIDMQKTYGKAGDPDAPTSD